MIRKLFTKFAGREPDVTASPLDVIFAYRFFLAREPDEASRHKIGFTPVRLAMDFLASSEFTSRFTISAPSGSVLNVRRPGAPPRELIEWCVRFFPLTDDIAAAIDRAPDWSAAVAALAKAAPIAQGLVAAGVQWTVDGPRSALAPSDTALDPEPLVGFFDGLLHGATAIGWVCDPRAPQSPAAVEFLVDGRVVHTAIAHIDREDVRRAGFGQAEAGFRIDLPLEPFRNGEVLIHARLAGTTWELQGSPQLKPAAPKLVADTDAADTDPAAAKRVAHPSTWVLSDPPVRAIAFYLPQFHPFPENNEWWGPGFTEWTNVTRGTPQFAGHYQPHRPGELGYYDLRLSEVQERQAELAKQFGLSGFCFYFYWFTGHILMERPIRQFADNDNIDFPFCLCWANENWTRRWDGLDSETLIAQDYSPEDDLNFITHISTYFHHKNYIKIDGRPLLIVYRPELFPDAKSTASRWRTYCRDAGIGEIFLASTHSFLKEDPAQFGFDAAVEFPPNNTGPHAVPRDSLNGADAFSGTVFDYQESISIAENYYKPEYVHFRGAYPSWDNTARRRNAGTIFINSTPEDYIRYLQTVSRQVLETENSPDRRLVFINAWNEWAEGAHLEPDERHGYAYLEATRMALIRAGAADGSRRRLGAPATRPRLAVIVHAFYLDVLDELLPYFTTYPDDTEFYFTTPQHQAEELRQRLSTLAHRFEIIPAANRGRDVAPFLAVMRHIWPRRFNYILKLHTKRSKHRGDGDSWRDDIFRTLAAPKQVAAILAELDNRPEVGVLGPAQHVIPMTTYWGSNRVRVLDLCRRLGVTEVNIRKSIFVAGTMFFARPEALEPLMGLCLTDADFEAECGQVDGTLAHAIERVISFSAAASAKTVCGASVYDGSSSIISDCAVASYTYADPTLDES